ncbi:meiotic recombination protein SPO11 isoform X2 [Micropterus dolomieu]|uniref:meiotic recombination protein SPO11 isoform X2 n=2 Tax=Micropterus dolomieu TaxID=147949 RepID=UPI001E8D8CF8|nr:meiotic recombination protein SPO11 isoform X2 [Micropterus dolomieu]
MMGSRVAELFSEIDKFRAQLLQNVEVMTECQHVETEICHKEILTRIENVILGVVTSLSKDEAPVLALPNRSSWANVSFDSAIGLQMSSGSSVTSIRSDCASSVTKFARILKILLVIYRLVQSSSYATKRDIYYNNTQLFGSQKTVDGIVDDISSMLKVPRRSLHVLATSKGLISGDLCYLEEDGTRIDCHSSSAAVAVSSNIGGIRNIVSSAKFVLIVEKDATFQRLLDDDFCAKLCPCIIITGKGVPDVNSRLMVRKLWDTLHIPIFALVDADPHVGLHVSLSQQMLAPVRYVMVPSLAIISVGVISSRRDGTVSISLHTSNPFPSAWRDTYGLRSCVSTSTDQWRCRLRPTV